MSPPKRRKTDKHLPPRVYHKHKAFFYVTKDNKWIRLGANFAEAMANWSKLVDRNEHIITMSDLFVRYMREIAPTKSKGSYEKNVYQMQYLQKVFGNMLPNDITSVDIYKYLDLRGKQAPTSANREKSLLSHVFSYAIRWGIVKLNPCRGVMRLKEVPRDRYVEDNEYHAVRTVAHPTIQLLMDFAYISGQRISDILKIKMSDLSDKGIYIQQSKTSKKLLILWSDELRDCVNKISKLPRSKIISFTLFCNTKGKPLLYDAFSTLWLKAVKKALTNGTLKERFSFHDLRAKSASDIKDRKHASQLLGHDDTRTTERIYNRLPTLVRPAK